MTTLTSRIRCRGFEDKDYPHYVNGGFTLIELIVVVAIVGILAGIAAPSFSTLIANQRAKSVATDIRVALLKARSEAIKRNTSVTLSPVATNNWQAGWQILDPADSMRKLEDHAAVPGTTITGPASVTYLSSGRISGNTPPSFDISAAGATTHWCGTVDLSGRPFVKAASSC